MDKKTSQPGPAGVIIGPMASVQIRKLHLALAAGLLWMAGCAETGFEARKHERWLSYGGLPQEQRDFVERGWIATGMSSDAVYIAWGPPSVEQSGEGPEGQWRIWRYGTVGKKGAGRWIYREERRPDGRMILIRERPGKTDTGPSSVEIRFLLDKVRGWQIRGGAG